MKTIIQLQDEFRRQIAKHNIHRVVLHGATEQGERILMGEHMTMSYPAGARLTREDIQALTALVERYYRPVVAVYNHPRQVVIYGWIDPMDNMHKSHEIEFVFETVREHLMRHPEKGTAHQQKAFR